MGGLNCTCPKCDETYSARIEMFGRHDGRHGKKYGFYCPNCTWTLFGLTLKLGPRLHSHQYI